MIKDASFVVAELGCLLPGIGVSNYRAFLQIDCFMAEERTL